MNSKNKFLILKIFLNIMLIPSCQPDFEPRTLIQDLRVLAIKIEPPEVYPGGEIDISALITDPLGNNRSLDWFVALCTPSLDTGECLEYKYIQQIYPDEDTAINEYAECCLRGDTEQSVKNGYVEIKTPKSFPIKTSDRILEGLSEEEAKIGYNAQIVLIACETLICSSYIENFDNITPELLSLALPTDQSSVSIKRIRISTEEDSKQNNNPKYKYIYIDGYPISNDEIFWYKPNETYTITPIIDGDSIEEYSYLNTYGETITSCESPYFSWYSTDGYFNKFFTEPIAIISEDINCKENVYNKLVAEYEGNYGEVEWTAPDDNNDTIYLYSVVWDRRGGMDWFIQPLMKDY